MQSRFARTLACVFTVVMIGCAARQPLHSGPAAARGDTARALTTLSDDLSPLREAFNDARHQWRIVALVSPTCSECILGAQAVEKEITRRYPAGRVAAFIVWIPMLEADSEQRAQIAATIFPPQRAAQFYDAQQTLGTRYARRTFAGLHERARASLPDDHWLAAVLDDREAARQPQWDLYMLYAPAMRWTGEAPPMPTRWIRHFGRTADRTTSTYWQDSPEHGPREGNLHAAIRAMADEAIGPPQPAPETEAAVRIELLGFDGCPNTSAMKDNVRQAVDALGLAANVRYVDVTTLPEDDARRGWPAPTVLVNGRDLLGMPEPRTAAVSCRTYPHGVPTGEEIAAALQALTSGRSGSGPGH